MTDASVVITCYNLERFIGAAIESVQRQDFGGSLQIIVVDDCSTDRSAEIIRSFDGVELVPMPSNQGVLLATLTGLERASSDIVFFLDGDDLWERNKIREILPRFAADPNVGFVTHDLAYADEQGEVLRRPTRPEQAMARIAGDKAGETVRRGILEFDDFVWLGSAFAIRKSAVRADEFIAFARSLPDPRNTYQDWPLAYWIAAIESVKLDYVGSKLFRYRLHRANYSGDARSSERAIRNLTRAFNTCLAMRQIAELRGLPERIKAIIDRRIAVNRYLIELNRNARGRALAGLLRCVPDFSRRGVLAKELVRFAGIQLLGAERFAQLAARRTVLRDLPVT